MTKFEIQAEEILDFLWRTSPVEATFTGIHDYDHKLDNLDPDFLEEKNNKTRAYLDRLERINRSELTADDDIDWQLLKNNLTSRVMTYEDIRYWKTYPSLYPEYCLYGLFVLVIRDFAPARERAAAFLSRLKQVPRLLAEGKRNLKDPPAVFTRLAIEVSAAGPLFFQSAVPEMAIAAPELAGELEKTSRDAQAAFHNYNDFLKDEWLGKSRADFAIGKDLFNLILRCDHMLGFSADEILEIGREAKRATETELKRTSRDIDPKKTWRELVEELEEFHPAADQLEDTYRRAMKAARDFVREKKLVTIPVGEELEVKPTLPFDRPTLPYAAYMSPAPFDKEQKGFFYVTPIDETQPPEAQRAQLKGHPSYGIPVIALHEAYPGHHLQLVLANRNKSKMRRIMATTVFIEGWALYCEEMMHEAGFYSDPRTVLFKLKDQLWRACRVIIDVSIHSGSMTFDQAVDLLVDAAKLQKVHAEKEVTRYTGSPTQPMSYLIGKKQIMELRRDYQAKMAGKFQLREFHDRLLSFGSIPVVLIRKAMGI
jgi:uncharacterized protein (DUF885 family)